MVSSCRGEPEKLLQKLIFGKDLAIRAASIKLALRHPEQTPSLLP
jgi:hypothetical protein